MANINSVITYNANLSPAQAQIKALTGQIASLSAAFNTLDKSALKAQASLASTFASNVGQVGGFTTQIVKVNTAVEEFGRSLQSQRLTMRQYFREAIAGYTKQNSLMKQLAVQQVAYQQSITVPMGMGPGGVGKAMVMTPTAMNAMANATALASAKFNIFNELITGGSTKLLNFGKNTQWAGRQLMVGFTLPLAMFTAAVSKQFRDLDKELTRFQKVYGQDLTATVKQSTDTMRKQVEQLAFSIGRNYGIAAQDTAALAADIAATGAEGEKLIKSVQETTRLAVLGEVDRQEAMKATLAIQSAFKMDTDELTQSINFLNAVENQTSTTLQDFATAIPRVGPVVQSLGGDIQDLAMMLVAMREGGVPAAEAANAIKSGLASMINPTQKASDVAKEFGINLNKIVEDNRGQLMPTIYAMQNALQGLDDFGRARVIEEIFGKYQFARMSALFENLGRMGSQTQSVLELTAKSSVELAAIANAELKTLQESTAMKFQRSLETLRNTLIPIGQVLTESLIPIFDVIGKGAQTFIEFFQSLPEPLKNFAKYGTAIAALAGPVVMLVGLFGNLIANGIKFGMMVVRLGARIAGLKVEKFQLLDAETAAARLGVDNLTQSFNTQDVALKKLTGALAAYSASLRTLQANNPALFVPGAMPGGRKTPVIRRQAGSQRPEYVPGTGRGDHVPALLEPGEFIVNRNAASQFAPLLSAMNAGKVGKYQEGGLVRAHISSPGTVSLQDPTTMSILRQISTGYARKLIDAMAQSGVQQMKVYSNLVLMLTESTNRLLTDSSAKEKLNQQEIRQHNQSLISQMKSQQAWQLMMDQTGMTFEELQPFIREVTMELDKLGNELIDDPVLYEKVDVALTRLANAGNTAATRLQVISGQYGAFQTMSVGPEGTRAGRRQAFGGTTAGVPGYTQLRPGAIPKIPLHERVPAASLSQFFVSGMSRGAAATTRSSSPSKEADMAGEATGKNIGRGAINGLKRGLNQSTSGKGAGSPVAVGMSAAKETDGGSRLGTFSNVAFAATMAASSITMMTGASGEAAAKIGLFTTALMVATTAMQMFSGTNVMGNFLGLGSLGGKLQAAGAARAAGSMGMGAPMAPLSMGVGRATGAGAPMKIPGGLAGPGAGLTRAGGMLSMLGGPAGMGAGIVITAAITGFIMYQKAAEEARKRAIAAFADPSKTAEFFGITVEDTVQKMKDLQTGMEEVSQIDTGLREAVKTDYADVIEKIRYSGAVAGSRELSLVFNKMLASGLDAEQAQASVKAIAVEAGMSGGIAYAQAMKQGMLEEMSTAEMVKRMPALFDPEQNAKNMEIIKSQMEMMNRGIGTNIASNIAEGLDGGVADFLTGAPGRFLLSGAVGGLFMGDAGEEIRQNITDAANYSRSMEQAQASIIEMGDISADQIVAISKTMFETFEQAPRESIDSFRAIAEAGKKSGEEIFDTTAIKNFISELDPVSSVVLNALIGEDEDLAVKVMEAVSAGMNLQEIIENIDNLDPEINIRVDVQEAKNKIAELKNSLYSALGEDLQIKIDASDKAIQGFDKQIGRVQKRLDKGTETMQKNFEASQEASDAAIEGMQEEIDFIQEKIDKRREETQEKIDSLNKEKDQIQESTDAYIKSIQSRQRVDNFYANQRKSAFSALQKLASGDVFGFLQERTAMGQEGQQFAYDQQIQGIEDRRDREVKAIDDTIQKEQERQEEYEKLNQRKIDAINNQIEAERKLQEAQQKGFEADLEQFQKTKEKRIEDLQDAKAKEQIKREKLQEINDKANSQQIVSTKDLTKVLGPELAKPYIEEQKAIIRSTYLLELRKKDATQQSALDAIRPLLQTMYTGPDRVQGGGMQFDNASILAFLGLTARASGGPISGPGGPKSDIIPALLSNGEYVVQASSVNKYGRGMMDSINAGKFAEGGLIGGNPVGDAASVGARTSIGKALANLVTGRKFPAKQKKAPAVTPGTTTSTEPGTTTSTTPESTPTGTGGNAASNYALSQVGEPYVNTPPGANPPNSWDCTKLTSWAWAVATGGDPSRGYYDPAAKVRLTPYSYTQAKEVQTIGTTLDPSQWSTGGQPGDLLFFFKNGAHHASMYTGNGQIVEASSPSTGVRTAPYDYQWNKDHFSWAGRPKGFASGGFVKGLGGSRSDSIPAMLSNGEYVMKANAVNKYGRGFMDQVNAGNFNMPSMSNNSPRFSMPSMNSNASNINNLGGKTSNNVKIIINGSGGKSANAIANKVVSMINLSNDRRNHSRSI